MQSTDSNLSGEFTLTPNQPSTTTEASQPESTRQSSTFSELTMFSHFCLHPTNLTFQNKEPNEEILLVLRSHIITNAPWIILIFILIVAPLLLTLIPNTAAFIRLDTLTKTIMVAVYYLIVFGYAFLNFILWYFQVTVVTTQKIVDIDLNGILSRQVNESPLHSIQDIEYTQKGVIASFWDYGDIFLQTDTRTQNLEVYKAPHPAKVVDIISDLLSKKGGHV